MIKFVTASTDSFGRKRKHLQRACDSCRRRKKRCDHGRVQIDPPELTSASPNTNTSTSPSIQTSGLARQDDRSIHDSEDPGSSHPPERAATGSLSTQNASPIQAKRTPSGSAITRDVRPLDSRFIGALNPEGVFLDGTSPENPMGTSSAGGVGVWLAEKLGHPDTRPELLTAPQPSSIFYGFDTSILKVFSPVLSQECLSAVPPKLHCDALCDTYFRKTHPLFPIIDLSGYQELPGESPTRVLLTQGMCLVASMDFASRPHLVLANSNDLWDFRDFGRRILAAMRVSIEIGLVSDKVILIQAHALMSFFIDSQEGNETSTFMVGRAIQYVHSLGLHLKVRDGEPDSEYAKKAFCCVWVLDRLNAACHGRAVIMHARDISRPLRECFLVQDPPFRLICHIVELLDDVIKLYCPGLAEKEEPAEFPLFEDLVLQCDALHIPSNFLVAAEMLYHAVAMLSCRTTTAEHGDTAQTAAHVRRALSVEQLKAILAHGIPEHFVLLPFVPYSVGVSLSVAYRDLRRSKIGSHRARARDTLKENCRVLEKLGEIFWSAAVMAEMGNKTLKEWDRVYLNMTGYEAFRGQDKLPHSDQEVEQHPTDRPNPQRPGALEHNSRIDQDYDSFNFQSIPEFDLFDMFDPEFDLDTIDACLEQNLDLGIPTNRL